jgi:hypothetical protein
MFIAMRTPGHYCAEPFNYAAKQRLVDRRLQLATLRVHRGNTRTLGLNMRCAIVLSCFLAIGSASTSRWRFPTVRRQLLRAACPTRERKLSERGARKALWRYLGLLVGQPNGEHCGRRGRARLRKSRSKSCAGARDSQRVSVPTHSRKCTHSSTFSSSDKNSLSRNRIDSSCCLEPQQCVGDRRLPRAARFVRCRKPWTLARSWHPTNYSQHSSASRVGYPEIISGLPRLSASYCSLLQRSSMNVQPSDGSR